MRVLLAEDDALEQKTASTVLKSHGHTVVIAESTRKSLEALERGIVDMALLDVASPGMDGFGAIRAIRAMEGTTGAHLPIIAFAVRAVEHRDKCLAAGADDCLSKPIRGPELIAALDRVGGARISSSHSSVEVLDIAAALDRVEGDRDLLEEIARLFAEECPRNIEAIHQASEARDARLLERLAHTVKGSSANLGANAVSQAAFVLEMQAHAGDFESAAPQIKILEAEMKWLLPELESLYQKVAP